MKLALIRSLREKRGKRRASPKARRLASDPDDGEFLAARAI